MMRKKHIAGILLTVFVLLAVTSCGSGGETKSGGSEETQAAWTLPDQKGDNDGLTVIKTLDLSGKEVDQSIFTPYKYNLVVVWGTYCNPCIKAMPDDEKLYQEYKEKGLGMVSVALDLTDASGNVDMDKVSYAKELVDKQKVTYPVLLPSVSIMASVGKNVSVTPSYFFVDSKGNMTGTIYKGGRSHEDWQRIIKKETGI